MEITADHVKEEPDLFPLQKAMEITHDHVKEDPDLFPLQKATGMEITPEQVFLKEEIVEEKKSDLQSPEQVFLKMEIPVVEENNSDFEPSTYVFLKEEFAEVKFQTKVTRREEAAVVKDEINQEHMSSKTCTSEDDNLRYLLCYFVEKLLLDWMLKSIFCEIKKIANKSC
jgi:hypothetical protein